MIIVKLMGGLGNQLFQYAAAKNIAINNKTALLVRDLIKSLIGRNKIPRSNEIRSEFELKYPADKINSKYLAQIHSFESVALNVRKYDDALANSANQIYGICTTEY